MTIEVKIKSIGALQSGDRRDGSGKWFARDIVLEANDGSFYPDEFYIRTTGERAQRDDYNVGETYTADISFSVREWNGKPYQDLWLRGLAPLPPKEEDSTPAGQTSDEDKPL